MTLIGQAGKDIHYTLLARVESLRIGRSNRPQSLGVSLPSYMETEINPVSETFVFTFCVSYTPGDGQTPQAKQSLVEQLTITRVLERCEMLKSWVFRDSISGKGDSCFFSP